VLVVFSGVVVAAPVVVTFVFARLAGMQWNYWFQITQLDFLPLFSVVQAAL